MALDGPWVADLYDTSPSSLGYAIVLAWGVRFLQQALSSLPINPRMYGGVGLDTTP